MSISALSTPGNLLPRSSLSQKSRMSILPSHLLATWNKLHTQKTNEDEYQSRLLSLQEDMRLGECLQLADSTFPKHAYLNTLEKQRSRNAIKRQKLESLQKQLDNFSEETNPHTEQSTREALLITLRHSYEQQMDDQKLLLGTITNLQQTILRSRQKINEVKTAIEVSSEDHHLSFSLEQSNRAITSLNRQLEVVSGFHQRKINTRKAKLTRLNTKIQYFLLHRNSQLISNLEKDELVYKRKLKQLKETQTKIQTINSEIESKFIQIQQCAVFLDQLDDFDKLSIIFVYDQPENFELTEILSSVLVQMQNQHRLDFINFTFQEYLDHLKLSSVSSRMRQFLQFHKNDLGNVIGKLIQVFKILQTSESSLSSRYSELLVSKGKAVIQLAQLDNRKIVTEPIEPVLPPPRQRVQDPKPKGSKPDDLSRQSRFTFRVYVHLIQALYRLLNSLQNIKEVLKSCQPEDFDEHFYNKWTQNSLFTGLKLSQEFLDNQFHIKIIAQNNYIRHSNQLINNIYDQFEANNYPNPNKKSLITQDRTSKIIRLLLPLLGGNMEAQIRDLIVSNPYMDYFLSIDDVKGHVLLKHRTFDSIESLEIVLYELSINSFRSKVAKLFQIYQGLIIQQRDIRNQIAKASRQNNPMNQSMLRQVCFHSRYYKFYKIQQGDYKFDNWKIRTIRDKTLQLEDYYNNREDLPDTSTPVTFTPSSSVQTPQVENKSQFFQFKALQRQLRNMRTLPTKSNQSVGDIGCYLNSQYKQGRKHKSNVDKQLKSLIEKVSFTRSRSPTKEVKKPREIIRLRQANTIKTEKNLDQIPLRFSKPSKRGSDGASILFTPGSASLKNVQSEERSSRAASGQFTFNGSQLNLPYLKKLK